MVWFYISRLSNEDELQKFDEGSAKATSDIPKENIVTCEELWRLLNESDEYVLLVDARDDVERNVSTIQGSISYVLVIYYFHFQAEYLERLDKENFPFIKTVCYSTNGRRSGELVRELISKGVRAFSLKGGLIEWCNYDKLVYLLIIIVEVRLLILRIRQLIWFMCTIQTIVSC